MREHAELVKFRVHAPIPLVIKTGQLSIDSAVELIAATVKQLEAAPAV